MKSLCFILALLLFNYELSYSQTTATSNEEEELFSVEGAMLQESALATEPAESGTSTYDDGLTPQQKFEQEPKNNVHEYNYKQQVIVGGAVMFCVALAMIVNNNYNPKKLK